MLGNQEIVARTGIPKSTVSRLTYTLTLLGYLTYSDRLEKYQLAPGVLAFGYSLLSGVAVRQMARPMMQSLANRFNVTVALGSRDRLKLVYLESCRGERTLTLAHGIGTRLPIATSAMGRAFLAALPEIERDYLLYYIKRHHPENWHKVSLGIKQALRDYREMGFCLSVRDWERDVSGVGVPLILRGGEEIIAFNAGAPAFTLPRRRLVEEIGPALRRMVNQLAVEMTGGPENDWMPSTPAH